MKNNYNNKSNICPYLERKADNPNNPDVEKHYEKGDRWRPYCIRTQTWCTFNYDYNECIILKKAGE